MACVIVLIRYNILHGRLDENSWLAWCCWCRRMTKIHRISVSKRSRNHFADTAEKKCIFITTILSVTCGWALFCSRVNLFKFFPFCYDFGIRSKPRTTTTIIIFRRRRILIRLYDSFGLFKVNVGFDRMKHTKKGISLILDFWLWSATESSRTMQIIASRHLCRHMNRLLLISTLADLRWSMPRWRRFDRICLHSLIEVMVFFLLHIAINQFGTEILLACACASVGVASSAAIWFHSMRGLTALNWPHSSSKLYKYSE